jgi:hypothetical protein
VPHRYSNTVNEKTFWTYASECPEADINRREDDEKGVSQREGKILIPATGTGENIVHDAADDDAEFPLQDFNESRVCKLLEHKGRYCHLLHGCNLESSYS